LYTAAGGWAGAGGWYFGPTTQPDNINKSATAPSLMKPAGFRRKMIITFSA
jgi:hypothetical protein